MTPATSCERASVEVRIVPTLQGDGTGLLGTGFAMHAKNALGGASGAFILGTSPAVQPVFGGTLLVTPVLGVPTTFGGAAGVPGVGTASLPFGIPGDEALVGVPVYCQTFVLDGPGISMSNAVELWIG